MNTRTRWGFALILSIGLAGSSAGAADCPDLSGSYAGQAENGAVQAWVVTRDACRSVTIRRVGEETVLLVDGTRMGGATGKSWYTPETWVDQTKLQGSMFALVRSTYRLDAARNLVVLTELLNATGVRQLATTTVLKRVSATPVTR